MESPRLLALATQVASLYKLHLAGPELQGVRPAGRELHGVHLTGAPSGEEYSARAPSGTLWRDSKILFKRVL